MSRVLSLKSDSMQYPSTIINERGVTSEYTDIEYGERANTAGTWHVSIGTNGIASNNRECFRAPARINI